MTNLDVIRIIFPRRSSWESFGRHVSQSLRNVSKNRRVILSIAIEMQISNCKVLRIILISDRKGRYGFVAQFALISY